MRTTLVPIRLNFIFPLVSFWMLGAAHAGDIYKCTDALGQVTFQDQPCRAGDSEIAIHMNKPPPVPVDDADAAPESKISDRDREAARAATAARDPNPVALPALWFCTRPEDGTHYMSRDGKTVPRMVPAGILGIPARSLTTAYGPGGIGVSAPGVNKIPIVTTPQNAIAGAYIAIQDQCDHATTDQTCDYLHTQYNEVQEKLKHASDSDADALQVRQSELYNQLGGC